MRSMLFIITELVTVFEAHVQIYVRRIKAACIRFPSHQLQRNTIEGRKEKNV